MVICNIAIILRIALSYVYSNIQAVKRVKRIGSKLRLFTRDNHENDRCNHEFTVHQLILGIS